MMIKTAKEVVKRGFTCDNCLGREFAQVSTGLTNKERGRIIRSLLEGKKPIVKNNAQKDFLKRLGKPVSKAQKISPKKPKGKCIVCNGLFDRLDKLVTKTKKELKGIEYRTFVLGTRPGHKLIKKEEDLWGDVGIEYCEPIRSELNRELGKLLEKETNKIVDEKTPDIHILLDAEHETISITVTPLFFSGKYQKLVRGIPQTKWEMYKETVEDIMARPFMNASKGAGHSLHAAGREDIDARCLDWRPFVLEIKGPKKRDLNIKAITKEVNSTGKVKINDMKPCSRKDVVRTKEIRPDKTYKVSVLFEKNINGLEHVKNIIGIIEQKTPERVIHRRADKLRKRRVKKIKWKKLDNKRAEFEIRGEAGLYIKELVTGDKGRTSPSLSNTLHNKACVEKLDVVKIHMEDINGNTNKRVQKRNKKKAQRKP